MKTTDLIPLILYQLVEGDKYGYEIVKQIEDASNGCISIKQPTLYSVLKKLEHGRVISSYWQDSEIGGKRHYYKLTPNGKAQLDTYPSFEQLIKEACNDDLVDINNNPTPLSQVTTQVSSIIDDNVNYTSSTMESIDEPIISPVIRPIELTIEGVELVENNGNVSAVDTINEDNSRELSIETNEIFTNGLLINETSSSNTDSTPSKETSKPFSIFDAIEPLSSTTTLQEGSPKFAESPSVTKEIPDANALYAKLQPSETLADSGETKSQTEEPMHIEVDQVRYLNYVDFSTDKATIKRRNAIKQRILKMSLTVISLIFMLSITIVIGANAGYGKLYYISMLSAGLIITLYPVLLIRSISKMRLQYCKKPFKYNLSRDFFVKLSIFLSLIICIFAYNLGEISQIADIFRFNNLSQSLSPILLSLVIMLDFAYSVLCYKKYR